LSRARTNDGRIEAGLVLRLAAADLRHEWILSLCLVLALAAVIAPLLLIFGLKYGTIETLRFRLIQDPVNREIRPLTSVSRGLDWFHQMARQPEVGFIIPTTRQIAATVTVKPINAPTRVEADLIPTGDGDRLLLANGSAIPTSGEVVLSAIAAQTLNVQTRDHVSITVTRSRGAESERASVEVVVAGTLGPRASGLKAVYTPLPFLEAVEAYKDGLAVPELHWEGSFPVASPEYDGAIVVLPRKLSEQEQLRLIINTGFSKIDEIAVDRLPALTGWSIAPGRLIYWLSTESSTVRDESLLAVKDQLRGLNADVFPWVHPIEAEIQGANSTGRTPIRIQCISVLPERAAELHVSPVPRWGAQIDSIFQIMLPAAVATNGRIELSAANVQNPLSVPVEAVSSLGVPPGTALAPAPLAGLFRLSQTRPLHYDERSGQVLLERRHYAGFRMYARTINDVEPLRRLLAAEGIEVHTESQRISEVTELDRHLTRIFWLIATVGMAGGVAALVASLYASIERKRRELAVLRLIGLSRSCLIRFPVYQSLVLATGSYFVAAVVFHGIAITINQLFSSQLHGGERFCRLPAVDQIGALIGALFFAVLAATLAAARVNSSSPAEALREE
jgi:putative ABC transport system permease protein